MKISRLKKYNGFTLLELIVVVAGLATLAGISIPAYVDSIRLNKSEQVKAAMNGYIVDCFSEWRSNPDTSLDQLEPKELDGEYLSTLGYKIDGKKNCDHVAIAPIQEEQKQYGLEFRISEEGDIARYGTPTNSTIKDNRFINSCKGWAGSGCSLSGDQKEEFERLALIAKAKKSCNANYNNWLSNGNSGEFLGWDNTIQSCTKRVFAFEGLPVSSLEAVDEALKAKYGKACLKWRSDKIAKGGISKDGIFETKSPECGGVKYWYYAGKEFTSQIDWIEEDNKVKKQKCQSDRAKAMKNKQGKYRYGPTPGPSPCGRVVYLCKGSEYNSLAEYATTSCGDSKKVDKPKKKKPAYCKKFKPDKRCLPKYKGIPAFPAKSSQCQCPYP